MEIMSISGRVLRTVEGSSLADADFEEADLAGAILRGVDLSGSNFVRSDLSGSNLRGAVLSGAVLSGANLSGTGLTKEALTSQDVLFDEYTVFDADPTVVVPISSCPHCGQKTIPDKEALRASGLEKLDLSTLTAAERNALGL